MGGKREADSPTRYRLEFDVVPAKVVYRSARITPKPRTTGPQTAVVTGPAGEEIYTDEYGRVKVQFHWDRYGQKDETPPAGFASPPPGRAPTMVASTSRALARRWWWTSSMAIPTTR